jgi:acylphosphatase
MKLKAIIKGKVHGVGYRVKLINIALEYGIDRFNVFNTEINGKQAIICLIDTPDEIIKILKERIKIEKPEKAVVESIEFKEYHYEVPQIERCMQAFQMEHWGRAIPILIDIRDKQDETIKVIREESEKTREELGSTIREESEKTREELGGKLDLLRSDLREYMESNLRRIYDEISEIKEALRKAGIM